MPKQSLDSEKYNVFSQLRAFCLIYDQGLFPVNEFGFQRMKSWELSAMKHIWSWGGHSANCNPTFAPLYRLIQLSCDKDRYKKCFITHATIHVPLCNLFNFNSVFSQHLTLTRVVASHFLLIFLMLLLSIIKPFNFVFVFILKFFILFYITLLLHFLFKLINLFHIFVWSNCILFCWATYHSAFLL